MNTPPLITKIEMARQYCERQEQEPLLFLQIIEDLEYKFHPLGFALLECQALDSSELGMLWVLPYGPNNTFKTLESIAQQPISRNGMASNMSIVKAYAVSSNSVTENQP